jgi:hypothetical protein
MQADHQPHRTSGAAVVGAEARRKGSVEFFP